MELSPIERKALLLAIDLAAEVNPSDPVAALREKPEGWSVSKPVYAAALEFDVCPSTLQRAAESNQTRCAVLGFTEGVIPDEDLI